MSLSFEEKLKNYAEVLVHIGVNVQPGQKLLIGGHRNAAPLVYEVARAAYRARATFVDVVWYDDELKLIQLTDGSDREDNLLSPWSSDVWEHYIENGGALLSVVTTIPGIFDDVPNNRMQAYHKAQGQVSIKMSELMRQHNPQWSVTNMPAAEWAARVFPDLSTEDALARLWDAVFKTVRADQPNPVDAWEKHITRIFARRDYLTAKQYTALQYTAPGTDLTIGLVENHRWVGGGSMSPNGIRFTPNIPTEEVFTMPHREKTKGVVRSTMPLSTRGVLIDDFSLTFEDGHVVDFEAGVGEEHLRRMIETDEGAARLGEVALVSHSSPISQMGFIFYHTLYDENASCHIALGSAYRESIEGGQQMDDDAFRAAGGNTSIVHLDFMIGSDELDIDGVLPDGTQEPIMRGGEWAFDV